VITGNSNGQAIVNVLHVMKGALGDPWNQTQINNLATLIELKWRTILMPRIAVSYSGDTVECTDLTNANGVVGVKALAGTGAGSNTALPQSAAACITWKIARHYRGGHPRTYIGPLATTAIESPVSLASAYVASLQTDAGAFRLAVFNDTTVGTQLHLGTVHRTVGGATLSTPLFSEFTAESVDARIDSQRRRLGPDR